MGEFHYSSGGEFLSEKEYRQREEQELADVKKELYYRPLTDPQEINRELNRLAEFEVEMAKRERSQRLSLNEARRLVAEEIVRYGTQFATPLKEVVMRGTHRPDLMKGVIVGWVNKILPDAQYDGSNILEKKSLYWDDHDWTIIKHWHKERKRLQEAKKAQTLEKSDDEDQQKVA